MQGLSVWEFGAINLGALSAALVARQVAGRRFVKACPRLNRSLCQFRVDMFMFFAAGLAISLFNVFAYSFPFVQSGLKVVVGYSTVGLFAAVDLALERERSIAQSIGAATVAPKPPADFYPMTRRFTLVSLVILLLVTAIMVLVVERDLAWFSQVSGQAESLSELHQAIIAEMVFVMVVLLALVVNLIYSYSRNLKLLFHNQTNVLEKVSQGSLDQFVPVVTQDEFGFIAGHTNNMIEGLKDRLRLAEGMKVAQEVQQNLLPQNPPQVGGLRIAAKNLYSDETGGDYLDFLQVKQNGAPGLGIVVGDVSGHGIGAALLMASVRGFLRQRAALSGDPADMLSDVNRQLVHDTEDTGRFMSLFLLVVDSGDKGLTWVSCGHDPALILDPETGGWEELKGQDLVLGVLGDWSFSQQSRPPLKARTNPGFGHRRHLGNHRPGWIDVRQKAPATDSKRPCLAISGTDLGWGVYGVA